MSNDVRMPDRLDGRMEYAQMQTLFSQLAQQVESAGRDSRFADEVDDFIRRLIQERDRDQQGLRDAQTDYESFKDENRGVFGWVKRHIPFTDTRRQERGHRSELSEQMAEILADNFVIARAEMLKERILTPDRRRLGVRAGEWTRRWESERANPATAGRLLQALHDEIVRSLAFTKELQRDIEAFGQAAFRDASDTQRRDEDLAAAKREFGELTAEIHVENQLKGEGLMSIVAAASSELDTTDPQFHRDGQAIELIKLSTMALTNAQESLAKVAATAGKTAQAASKLHSIPEQIGQIRQSLAQYEGERTAAEQAVGDRLRIVEERQARAAEAQRSLEQAKQTLVGLQSSYDAHVARRSAEKVMPTAVEAEPSAPIVQQHRTAAALVSQAEAQYRDIVQSVDAARKEVAAAEQNIKSLKDKIGAEQARIRELQQQEPALRSEMNSLAEAGQREFAAASNSFASYLAIDRATLELPPYRPDELAAFAFGWLGPRGMERSLAQSLFYPGFELNRQTQAVGAADRLLKWLDGQKTAIGQRSLTISDRRRQALQRHCQLWLGENLAQDACR